MRRDTCNVCRGNGRVRLPIYTEVSLAGPGSADVVEIMPEPWREFPCPACSDMVPSTRLTVIQEVEVQERRINDPDFIEHVQRCLASALAASLFKRRLIKFEEGQVDQFKMTRAIIASVNVVAPETYMPERTMVLEAPTFAQALPWPPPKRSKTPRPPRPKKPKPQPPPRNPFGRVIDL